MQSNWRMANVWDWITKNKTKTGIIISLLIILPYVINLFLLISNRIYGLTGININAVGITNQDWFSFWGSFSGGIATFLAVIWTLRQTQTIHIEAIKEQERQRKLDVLPVIILQPIVTKIETGLVDFFSEGFGKEESMKKRVFIDELKPIYEEYQVSEVTW